MVCFTAALGSLLLTGFVRRDAIRRGLIDQPGERSSHQVPTPTGGGAGFVAALLMGLLVLWVQSSETAVLAVTGCLLVMAALGWWDDHRPLSARLRFTVQVLVCLIALAVIGGVGDVLPSFVGDQWLWCVFALVTMVWLVNLTNFMDGTDGLTGTQLVITLLLLAGMLFARGGWVPASVAWLGAAVIGGFLPWNLPLPKARVFMGDVGSATGGLLLAVLCLWATHYNISVQVLFIAFAVFVVDATATLLRRMVNGEQWYNAHRQHAYQRLVRATGSHARVLLIYTGLNLVLIVPAVLSAWHYPQWQSLVAIIVTILLLLLWAYVQRRYK